MSRITINLTKEEVYLKTILRELRLSKDSPFSKRSESEIAKMLLEPALKEAHRQYGRKTGKVRVGTS